jgi:hypothetical protein
VAQVEALDEAKTAEVLAAWVKAKRAELPEGLAKSASKPHAKLAKKALYQLKSGGVAVAEPKPAFTDAVAPLPTKEDTELYGTMSTVLGTGNRAVYRTRMRELRAQSEISLLYCPLPRILEELGRGLSMNEKSSTALSQDMSDGLRELGVVPLDPEWAVPSADAADAGHAESSAALFNEKEIAEWLPPETQLSELSTKSAEFKAATSDMKAFEQQRAALAETMSKAFFTTPLRRIFARRLWLTAEVYEQQGRAQPAALARATARALYHHEAHLPFLTSLFTRSFTLSAQDKVKAMLETMRQDRLTAPPEERLGADRPVP